MGFLKRISQMFCRHNVVRVIRWHASCVTPQMRNKVLYVDRLAVHNFVQCACCERILWVDQSERLFEQPDPNDPVTSTQRFIPAPLPQAALPRAPQGQAA